MRFILYNGLQREHLEPPSLVPCSHPSFDLSSTQMAFIFGPHGVDPVARRHTGIDIFRLLVRVVTSEQNHGVFIIVTFERKVGSVLDFLSQGLAEVGRELYFAVVCNVSVRI
jgi:hypothetical protein